MDNYTQHMRHWGNHRKDRYTQQCSGYHGNPDPIPKERDFDRIERESFAKVIDQAKDKTFPIYIASPGGVWDIVPHNHIGGSIVKSYEELIDIGKGMDLL